MKKYKFLSLLILAAVSLASCSVHEVKSKGNSEDVGATVVKIRSFMAWQISMRSDLRENGIEKLSSMEVINAEDPSLAAKYSAEIDEEVAKKKMESALTVRDEEDNVDIFIVPEPKKEGLAKAMVIKVQEPDELTIVKLRGRFNFNKMIGNMENYENQGDGKGKKKNWISELSL